MHNHGISGSVAANGRSSQAGSPLLVSVSPVSTMGVNVYSTWSNYRNWAHCKLRNALGATKCNASMRDQFSAGNKDIWEGSLCNSGPDHICPKALGRMVGTQVCAWSSGMTQGQLVQPSVLASLQHSLLQELLPFRGFHPSPSPPAPHTNIHTSSMLLHEQPALCAGSTFTLNAWPFSYGVGLLLVQASQPPDLIGGQGSVSPWFPG